MKYDKYTILFLSSWYPNRIFPFQGDFVKRHAKAVSLFSKVICLHVVIDTTLKTKYIITEHEENDFKEIIIYFNRKSFKKLYYNYYFLKGFTYLKRKFGKPDLIHGNVLYPKGIVVFLLSFLYKIPYIFTEHWTGFLNGSFNKLNSLTKYIYQSIGNRAKKIMPVTQNLAMAMKSCGVKGDYTIVPNVVEIGIFKFTNLNQTKVKSILHVSNIDDDHKNISGLLRVIERLSKNRQDFILNIINSEDNHELVKLADSYNILNRFVIFYGAKKYQEVAEFMNNSAFLVLFSNYENLPCVIIEAFASGLPVLSTDVGGIKEHLDNKKGILINKSDESALLEKMNYLLDHHHEYDKALLHNYAVDNFSYQEIGHKFYNIYKEVLGV